MLSLNIVVLLVWGENYCALSNSIEVPQFEHLQHLLAACGDVPVYIVTVDGTGLVTMHEFCNIEQLELLDPV